LIVVFSSSVNQFRISFLLILFSLLLSISVNTSSSIFFDILFSFFTGVLFVIFISALAGIVISVVFVFCTLLFVSFVLALLFGVVEFFSVFKFSGVFSPITGVSSSISEVLSCVYVNVLLLSSSAVSVFGPILKSFLLAFGVLFSVIA